MNQTKIPEPYWKTVQLQEIHIYHFALPSFLEEVEYGKLSVYRDTLTRPYEQGRENNLPPATWSIEEKAEFGGHILKAIANNVPITTHIIIRPIIFENQHHDEIWNGFNELQVLFSFCDEYQTQKMEIMIQPGMQDIVGAENMKIANQRFHELRKQLLQDCNDTNILN